MRRLALVSLMTSTLLAPAAADAVELRHRFGLGYQGTLAGSRGLNVRYFAADNVGLELVLGFTSIQPNTEDSDSWNALEVAGGFSVVLAHDERGQLALGTRINVGTSDETESVTDIAFEVPFTLEYFITDHFSLFAAVGLVLGILHDEGRVLMRDDKLDTISPVAGGMALAFGSGDVLANAGFTVWL